MLVSQDWHNKTPQTGWLATTWIYFSHRSRDQSLESKRQAGSRFLRLAALSYLFWLEVAATWFRCMSAQFQSPPLASYGHPPAVSVCPPLFSRGHPSLDIGPTRNLGWLHLNFLNLFHIQRPYFQIRSPYETLGVVNFGGTLFKPIIASYHKSRKRKSRHLVTRKGYILNNVYFKTLVNVISEEN